MKKLPPFVDPKERPVAIVACAGFALHAMLSRPLPNGAGAAFAPDVHAQVSHAFAIADAFLTEAERVYTESMEKIAAADAASTEGKPC